MAIILNPLFVDDSKVSGTTDNTYYSPRIDDYIKTVYIVVDQLYINKSNSELRVQVDFYMTKNARKKNAGLLESVNYYPTDLTDFIGTKNIFQAAYTYIMSELNKNNVDKYISD